MARDELALYLTLSPEFGGTRFGPFEGLEVRLGADRERCHIVLPEAFGVAREHCKVIRQGEGLILAASERTAAVFVWKGDARRPAQIQAPTSIRPGDSFALVSPEGARFAVELAPLPAEMIAARQPRGRRNNLTADKFAQEGWRLLLARIWTLGPFGLAMRGWYMITSGSIFQPRILIPLAIAAVGYLGAFGSSCAAFKFKADQKKAEKDLASCNDKAGATGGASGMDANVLDLITEVDAGNKSLSAELSHNSGLLQEVTTAIKDILQQQSPTPYDWALNRDGGGAVGDWVKLRGKIEKSDEFDELTKLLLPYTSALPKRTGEGWNFQLDTLGSKACLRGPGRLTFRQGRSLGLETVQLDGYHDDEMVGYVNDDAGRLALLQATASPGGVTLSDPPPPTEEVPLASGREYCVFASGDDDRDDLSKVVRAYERQFGSSARFVPGTANNAAAVARLVKFYAADVPGNSYAGDTPHLDFTNSYTSPLDEQAAKDTIVKRTAAVIARSVALPCIAALSAPDLVEATYGRKVDPVACLVLKWKLEHPAQ